MADAATRAAACANPTPAPAPAPTPAPATIPALAPEPRASIVAKRIAVIAALIVLAAAITALCLRFGPDALAFVADAPRFRSWIDEAGIAGSLAFVGANVAQVVIAFLPGEPLELAAGYAFGFWEGTALCLLASALGTTAVMAIVRTFGVRAVNLFFPVEKIRSVRWIADARRFELLLFLCFLIPGTPKDLLTYAAGLTDRPVGRIVAITTVGRIPSVVSSTLAAGALGDGNYLAAGIVAALAIALAGAGVALYRVMAKRAQEEATRTTDGTA